MGRSWQLDDDYYYSLNPNERYSERYLQTMEEEWLHRVQEQDGLVVDCRERQISCPRRRAILMPRVTPQEKTTALNRIREENNRMVMRMQRLNYQEISREYALCGYVQEARARWELSIGPQYRSDIEMSDEENN